MNLAVIALGSNIDKEQNLPHALALLGEQCEMVAVSSIYETVPVGLREQPNFHNAAVLVRTPLDAQTLKRDVLRSIEQALKRVRVADKNAPRTIDLDIVLFNAAILPELRIPDPDLLRFAHVAVPVAEIAPEMLHSETGEKLISIAERLFDAAEDTIWKHDTPK